MSDIEIYYKDDVHFRIRAERSILSEISEYFTFKSPKFFFHPKFKAKKWDGRIHLFKIMTGELYNGLYPNLLKFAKDRDYTVNVQAQYGRLVCAIEPSWSNPEKINDFLDKLKIKAKRNGQYVPLELYDYQRQAIIDGIQHRRRVFLSATNSGKSAIIYSLLRWWTWDAGENNNNPFNMANPQRYLLVVPTTALVEQMYTDFEEYAHGTGWNVEDHVQRIYQGHSKDLSKPIVISTWQSIYQFDHSWFKSFNGGIADEVHKCAKAECIKGIFEKMRECPIKIGLTGTLDNEKLHKLVLQGLFGPVQTVVTTKELVVAGRAAEPKIKFIVLKYSEEDRKLLRKLKSDDAEEQKKKGKQAKGYQVESNFIINHPKRNKFIRQLALMQKKNTLVLFHFVEKHGIPMFEEAKKLAPEKPIYYISGQTDTDDREEIRHAIEDDENALLYASYGTVATGTNIRKLVNLIFSYPFEAKILNLQSIGRVIRLHETKKHVNIYDFVDDLTWKTSKGTQKNNYLFKHFLSRLESYKDAGFDIEFLKVDLEKI